MSGPGGIQLSPTQIVASLLATLTGAFLASYLGVGGTLAGAAVGSIASTTGTEVYRHYLRRSQERLKAAGEVLRTHHQTGQHTQPAQRVAAQSRGTARLGDAATETLATSPAGHTAAERAHGELSGPPAGASEAAAPSDGAAPAGGAALAGGGSGPWWRSLTRRQWLIYGGVALGLFLAVMVVVTIVELSVGKPLDAAVWGKHSTGTSVSTLVGGGGSPHKKPATPASSTPGTQSSSTAPSSTPAATPSGIVPSPTTSASTGPSTGSGASPTPGTGQGSAQAATPSP